jgi:hypothetical protein
MTLTREQRSELEIIGLLNVRAMLASAQGGRDAVLNRFLSSGDVSKGDVIDWLLEKSPAETAQQRATFRYSKMAAWAAIAATVLALGGLVVAILGLR